MTAGTLSQRGSARTWVWPAALSAAIVERPRRILQIAFGLIWLLDAALQYQPYMFGHGLADQIVAPTGQGSPSFIAGPVGWTARLIDHQTVAWNILFATVQLAIAVGMFSRRTVRPALIASFVWALGLWWLAEGMGGVFAGPVPPEAGLPGAAVIYAVLSVLLWPGRADIEGATGSTGSSVAERSPLRTWGIRGVWIALWVSFAFEALRPADRSPSSLHDLVAGNESGEPSWLKSMLRFGASGLAHHGTEFSIGSAIAFAVIAVGVLVPAARRPAIVIAVVAAALIWIFGEAFGEIPTGQATDPNSGPLLALLAISLWPTASRSTYRAVGSDPAA